MPGRIKQLLDVSGTRTDTEKGKMELFWLMGTEKGET